MIRSWGVTIIIDDKAVLNCLIKVVLKEGSVSFPPKEIKIFLLPYIPEAPAK